MLHRNLFIAIILFIFIEFCFIFISDELAFGKWVFKLTGTIQISRVFVRNNISSPNTNASEIQPNITSMPLARKSIPLKIGTLLNGTENNEYCIVEPLNLKGRQKILLDGPSIETLAKTFANLYPGGRFKPDDCRAKEKIAIIVPFRDREQHLRIFLHNLHPLLQRQKLDYGIYIVEQMGSKPFNRAMLMNIGYVEALKQYDYDCFIFHDVDLIPEDDRNPYKCSEQPRHMSVAIDKYKYAPLYEGLFGGVSAMSKKHMETVNGFSNSYWGWGAEDDDMSNRIKYHHLKITRYPSNISYYTMLKHKKAKPMQDLAKKLNIEKKRFHTDGLNSLKYERVDILFRKLYTWIVVNI
ncbi:beta-1,4-N-acetylgalactosaminyltransferase bre-4-like [Parasteatoda tepidariorum]|uniref:beta-1,4-N-acetylgalactosaminyltransferase bre-4-like n=1 Tax=Parasteatoda tepidariorum TaxID=114398 RepID=UPI00077F87DC|nr:beta-1,4-N-acetylgalactosaminyltransferase bre-4-like [Parasteatoda tepidariorum]